MQLEQNPYLLLLIFKKKTIIIDGKSFELHIRDTLGTERFHTVSANLFRNIHAVLICFDLSAKDTFLACKTVWCKEANRYSPNTALKFFIGNKSDLPRDVDASKVKAFVDTEDNEIQEYFEVSAKDNINIDVMFEKVVRCIRDKLEGKTMFDMP